MRITQTLSVLVFPLCFLLSALPAAAGIETSADNLYQSFENANGVSKRHDGIVVNLWTSASDLCSVRLSIWDKYQPDDHGEFHFHLGDLVPPESLQVECRGDRDCILTSAGFSVSSIFLPQLFDWDGFDDSWGDVPAELVESFHSASADCDSRVSKQIDDLLSVSSPQLGFTSLQSLLATYSKKESEFQRTTTHLEHGDTYCELIIAESRHFSDGSTETSDMGRFNLSEIRSVAASFYDSTFECIGSKECVTVGGSSTDNYLVLNLDWQQAELKEEWSKARRLIVAAAQGLQRQCNKSTPESLRAKGMNVEFERLSWIPHTVEVQGPQRCVSYDNKTVSYFEDASLNNIGVATHDGFGNPIIVVNPIVMGTLKHEATRQFWYAHECAHHHLPPWKNTEPNADCFAIQTVVEMKIIEHPQEMEELLSQLASLAGSHTHLPGPLRAGHVKKCSSFTSHADRG